MQFLTIFILIYFFENVVPWSGHLDMVLNRSGFLVHITLPRVNNEGERELRGEYVSSVIRQVAPDVTEDEMPVHRSIMGERLDLLQAQADETLQAVDFSSYVTPAINSPALFKFPEDGAGWSHVFTQSLVAHVQMAVYNARRAISKLTYPAHSEVLEMDGMSTASGRHLLNNLCSALNTRYLEVGVWRGSSLVSAIAGNEYNVAAVTAIDMWGWDQQDSSLTEFNAEDAIKVFGDAENALLTTLSRLDEHTVAMEGVQVLREDCFQVDVAGLVEDNGGKRFNVYFYDAGHTAAEQKQAFTHYNRYYISALTAS